MKFSLRRFVCPILVVTLATLSAPPANAQEDPSIDRLLKKLPPPEKLVKPSVARAINQPDPALRDPLVQQIAAASQSNNNARALDLVRKLSAKHSKSPGAKCLHGILAFVAGQNSEAAIAFRNTIAARPDFSLAHLGLAAIEVRQGRYGASIPHLRALVRLEPKYAFGWMALSESALRSGNKQEGVEAARRCTAVAPSAPNAWLQLARAERAVGNAEGTLRALSRGAEVSPDSAEIMATVGFAYINLNRIPQAIPPLQRAVRLAPKDFLVHAQLGFCLQTTGQVDAGIKHLRTGANLAPKNYGPVWNHLGLAYQKKGMHREAVQAFERAVQIMPTYRAAWQHLAEEYRALGQAAKAEQAAARARSLPALKSAKR